MKRVPVESHYFWRVKDGEKKEGVKRFSFDRINVDKIKRASIISQFSKKKWIKKVGIEESTEESPYVVWKYKNKPDVYVFSDGFFVVRTISTMNKEPTTDEINSVYRCASIINDAGVIVNFTLVI